MSPLSLEQKVWDILRSDGPGPVETAYERPREAGDLSQFELDLRDWGVVYGIAWAIARGQDPYENLGSVNERALNAADAAWVRWAGSGPAEHEERADGFHTRTGVEVTA